MTFADIPDGAAVYLDANVFVYYAAPNPTFGPTCRVLIERVARDEITGFTSSHVLSNVAHRLMTYEAVDVYGWPMAGIAQRLKRHPAELQALTRFRHAVEEVPNFGVRVLPVTVAHAISAAAVSQQYGLLSGDALIAAVMQANGLVNLTSNDGDFDRVPWITRYSPA
jgi:predicted nucleic acid-binding protein